MTMSDPIADMLTRIRNANTAKHDTVDVPSSKMKLAIANILLDEGYIEKYDVIEDGVFKTIHITLKYGADKNEKVITGLKRISKPGLRVYANSADVPKVFGRFFTLCLIFFAVFRFSFLWVAQILKPTKSIPILQGRIAVLLFNCKCRFSSKNCSMSFLIAPKYTLSG